MPDLFAHVASGFIVGRRFFFDHRLGFILLGSVLPDLMSRVPQIILQRFLDLPVAHFFSAFHTPVALIVSSYLISFVFAPNVRKIGFWLMLSGSLFHFGLDLLQRQFYKPIYMPWFPFSFEAVQFPWFHIHASLLVAPIFLLAMLYLWARDLRHKRAYTRSWRSFRGPK